MMKCSCICEKNNLTTLRTVCIAIKFNQNAHSLSLEIDRENSAKWFFLKDLKCITGNLFHFVDILLQLGNKLSSFTIKEIFLFFLDVEIYF